ncbi:MAG: hypothetical protein JJ974_06775 [Phycisphaerales bacterium]|nr:hypothetical protein [Phycisphaerales bacterium]
MNTPSGDLARSRRNHQSTIPAGLEDHALLLDALISIAIAQQDDTLWTPIERLFITTRSSFESDPGVYHDTREDRSDLFIRPRSFHDGATPSGVGMMTLVLTRMIKVTGEERWVEWSVEALKAVSASIESSPTSVANSTRALIALMTSRELVGDLYTFAGARAESENPNQQSTGPVTVYVSEDSVVVDDDTPASFSIALEIDEPYHIVGSDPGDSQAAKGLIPLRVGLIEGQGVAVYAQYPDSEPFGSGDEQIMINEGRIEFEVAVEKADGIGPTPGHPILGITFQPCSDTQCLAPITVRLPVELTIK